MTEQRTGVRARFDDLYERSEYPETRAEYTMAFARVAFVLIILFSLAAVASVAAAVAFALIFAAPAYELPLYVEVARRIVGLLILIPVGAFFIKFFEPP